MLIYIWYVFIEILSLSLYIYIMYYICGMCIYMHYIYMWYIDYFYVIYIHIFMAYIPCGDLKRTISRNAGAAFHVMGETFDCSPPPFPPFQSWSPFPLARRGERKWFFFNLDRNTPKSLTTLEWGAGGAKHMGEHFVSFRSRSVLALLVDGSF